MVSMCHTANSSQTCEFYICFWLITKSYEFKALIHCLKSADKMAFRLWEKMKADGETKCLPSEEELRLAANMEPLDPNEATILRSSLIASSVGVMITEQVPTQENIGVSHSTFRLHRYNDSLS